MGHVWIDNPYQAYERVKLEFHNFAGCTNKTLGVPRNSLQEIHIVVQTTTIAKVTL